MNGYKSMTSDVVKLLEKLPVVVSEELNKVWFYFKRADKEYREAKEHRDFLLAKLQEVCPHPVILEDKGGRGYSAGGTRVCKICGLWENQPISNPGDEYDFATYGAYKILTGSQYSYSSNEGREVYQVPRDEIFKFRI